MKTLMLALSRARYPVASIGITYLVSCLIGIIMVSRGGTFALNYRDQLVGDAVKYDAVVTTNLRGNPLKAAVMDFAGNLFVGSVSKSVMGMAIVLPYPFVGYQGWIGGIVSVRGDHTSRMNTIPSATYYVATLLLQLAAYSVSVGAGVNVGIAMLRPAQHYRGEKVLGIFPKEALLDWGRLYLLAIPIFFIASLWEFLSPWNF